MSKSTDSRFDSLCEFFLGKVVEHAPSTITIKHAKCIAEDMTYMVLHGLDFSGMTKRAKE